MEILWFLILRLGDEIPFLHFFKNYIQTNKQNKQNKNKQKKETRLNFFGILQETTKSL